MNISRLFAILALAGTALMLPAAQAQTWPAKPITLVVPFAPGGTTDIIARAIAQRMSQQLRQPVIVDNRPGAGGTLAAGLVAKAPADGYTLFTATIAHTMAPSLYKQLSYDFVHDFDPIGVIATTPNVLLVNNALPVKSVGELLAYIKAHPGEVNYGSAGPGSSEHLAGVLFTMRAGVDLTHVPYKGGAPMMTDLMGGQIQMAIETSPSAHPQVLAGKVRALAVTSPRRSASYPGVPTLAEAGVKDYDFITWFSLMVPHGTPAPVQKRLGEVLASVLRDPKMVKEFEDQGVEPGTLNAEATRQFIVAETAKWAQVVHTSGAHVD